MALEAKVGNFAKSTGGAPTDQAITGLSFLPKAMWFWATTQTAAGQVVDINMSVGVTDGTDDYSLCQTSEDAVATNSNCSRRHALKCITLMDTAATLLCEADLKSFDDNGGGDFGFTVTWTTNDGNAYIIHYLAVGGSDLTNAKVATFTAPTSSGDQSTTGTGFQPDMVFFLPFNGTSAAPSTSTSDADFGLGFGVLPTDSGDQQSTVACFSEDGTVGNANTAFIQRHDHCVEYVGNKAGGGAPVTEGNGSLKSLDSDGFTLTWGSVTSNALRVGYLALKGGSYQAGNNTAPTSTGNQSVTGVGFVPKALLFITGSDPQESLVLGQSQIAIGATSGVGEEGSIAVSDRDNVDPTEADQFNSTTKCITQELLVTAAQPDGEADLVSFDSDGYTIDWTSVNADFNLDFYHLAIGDVAAVGSQTIRKTVYY